METRIVKDMTGIPIKPRQRVVVFQDEGPRIARVVTPFPDSPTVLKKGFWVDVDFGYGPEGIPSYIIQIV